VVTRRLRADKIASVTRGLALEPDLVIAEEVRAVEGAVVAVRVLNDKAHYNTLEDVHGRPRLVQKGDVVVGALGRRRALHGYEGRVPASAAPGTRLALLNLGGVVGECLSWHPSVGPPFAVEVLGQVLHFPRFGHREGAPATVAAGALPETPLPESLPPVALIVGTSMDAGKTHCAAAVVHALTRAGRRVTGLKLTGVSLLRDVLLMRDAGARTVHDFTDAGLPSTAPETVAPAARLLLAHAARDEAEVIVAESGDGILGPYGVRELLALKEVRRATRALVLCAHDPPGAAAARGILADLGYRPTVVAGPLTDNGVGARFVREELGCAAANALLDPEELGRIVAGALGEKTP
jgi:hypothetical protein